MNISRFAFSFIAVFIFIFLSDFLIHGSLLTGLYAETSQLWRPQAEYKMSIMLIRQVLFCLIFVFFYTRNHEGKGVSEGIRFGLYTGLLLASLQIGTYSYMPIPLVLMLAWALAIFSQCFIMGIISSLLYKD